MANFFRRFFENLEFASRPIEPEKTIKKSTVEIPSYEGFVIKGKPIGRLQDVTDYIPSGDLLYEAVRNSTMIGTYNQFEKRVVVSALAGGLEVETLKAIQKTIDEVNPQGLRYDVRSSDIRAYIDNAIVEANRRREFQKRPLYQRMADILSQKSQSR